MLTLNIQNATIHLPAGAPIEAASAGTRMVMTIGDIATPADVAAGRACARSCGSAGPTLTPPAPGVYWPGQGGFYAGTWPASHGLPARHLIFSEAQDERAWGGYGKDAHGAKSRLDGAANTDALLASKEDHPAAQWAAAQSADGHNDFHLPAQADLFMAMLTCPERFETEGWYWSSTQTGSYYAFCQDFAYGGSGWRYEDNELRVRAVRWIQL